MCVNSGRKLSHSSGLAGLAGNSRFWFEKLKAERIHHPLSATIISNLRRSETPTRLSDMLERNVLRCRG